jgi:hypothetical protein
MSKALAIGILCAGAAAAAYLTVKKDGQSLASSVGGAVVSGLSDFTAGAVEAAKEAAKDTALGQGVTDILNHHDAMSFWETVYWEGLSHDKTWDGLEDRSVANSALNGLTWGAWGSGWFGLFD